MFHWIVINRHNIWFPDGPNVIDLISYPLLVLFLLQKAYGQVAAKILDGIWHIKKRNCMEWWKRETVWKMVTEAWLHETKKVVRRWVRYSSLHSKECYPCLLCCFFIEVMGRQVIICHNVQCIFTFKFLFNVTKQM